MQRSRMHQNSKDKNKPHSSRGGCKALCCSCKLSCSPEPPSSRSDHHQFRPSISRSDHHQFRTPSISSLAHAMVQERLNQIFREGRKRALLEKKRINDDEERRRRGKGKRVVVEDDSRTKFVVMMAMEKVSSDPREDFRDSMVEMIMVNGIKEPRDLRFLLNCYVSVNSEEYRVVILQAFYEVCTDMFSSPC